MIWKGTIESSVNSVFWVGVRKGFGDVEVESARAMMFSLSGECSTLKRDIERIRKRLLALFMNCIFNIWLGEPSGLPEVDFSINAKMIAVLGFRASRLNHDPLSITALQSCESMHMLEIRQSNSTRTLNV